MMNFFRFVLILVFFTSACTPKDIELKSDIKWTEFMSQQDMVWDTLTGYFYDGPMSGNGLLGVVIHRMDKDRFDGDTNKILFEINRADAVDSCSLQNEGYKWSRFAIGRFELKPKGIIKSITFRVDLLNATIVGTIITNKGTIKIKNYTHATLPVIVTETESLGDEDGNDICFIADNCGCIKDFVTVDFQEKAKYFPVSTFSKSKIGEVSIHHQPLNVNRFFNVGWKSVKMNNKTLHYSTIEYSNPAVASTFKAEQILDSISKINTDDLYAVHQQWWHAFYKKNFISVPDAQFENYWWIQQYKMGSTMRENLQLMDLMGPWYCHTPWRAIWWNWNTQAIYSSVQAMNNIEAAMPLIKIFDQYKNILTYNVPVEFRKNAMGIGRASSFDLVSPMDFSDTVLYAGNEPGNLMWAVQTCYREYRYIMNDSLLKESILPILKASVQLYINLLEKRNDGQYHLPITFSPEYKPAKDCSFDLALFKWGLKTLVEVCNRLHINDPALPIWKDIHANLAAFHTNETGIMIGEDVSLTESHRHFSHLLAFYPLNIIDLSKSENVDVLKTSINHWLGLKGGLQPWSHIAAAGMYNLISEGDHAYSELKESLLGFTCNTMYREAGMCSETPYYFVKVMTEMLLQSDNGVIRIFPAMPSDWKNSSFQNLRAEGAFLISAVRKNSKTDAFSIESLAGEKCVFSSDLKNDEMNASKSIHKISDHTYSVELNKGETLTITRKGISKAIISPVEKTKEKDNFYGKKTIFK